MQVRIVSKDKMTVQKIGNVFELRRNQWQGNRAVISDHPGLKDEVEKYAWTYTGGDHPYLRCSALKISLHRFVLDFLYGKECVDTMLEHDNIIEHIDNDGLNCAYDNLHILSADHNKAKAFTIDKEMVSFTEIPSFITDVYYSHSKKYYRMQIFFNRDVFYNGTSGMPVEQLYCQYADFRNLYIDWLYLLGCRSEGKFELAKLHANTIKGKDRPYVVLTEEEKDHVLIERDGKWLLVLRPDDDKAISFMSKTAFQDLDDD